jgi:glycosyltransferase involved in cell wall biosynthesis
VKSIVIPTHKHLEDCLKPCCESIIKNTDLSDVEVIIVANGCGDDGTRKYVDSLGAPFKLLWSDEGLGYTKAMNLGLAMAQGDILIPMNNDAVILDFQAKNVWLDRLLEPFKDPTVGMTGPLMITDEVTGRPFLVFFLAAFSRELYNKLGPLDEIFAPGGYEDVDYCLKAEALGYRVVSVAAQRGVDHAQGVIVTDYPAYHKGEATVLDAEHTVEWHKTIERNKRTLADRYPRLPEGSFWPSDVAEYRKLANEVPDGGTICELGLWKGRSLSSIADIIKRKHLKVIAVDTFQGSTNYEPEMLIARSLDMEGIFRANMQKFGLNPTIHRMTGDEAVQLMEDRSIDLLFIDANHSYEAVKNDLEKWEPKVRGVVGGHDYNGPMYPNPSWPGVKRAVDERYRDIHYDGISLVWSKKL